MFPCRLRTHPRWVLPFHAKPFTFIHPQVVAGNFNRLRWDHFGKCPSFAWPLIIQNDYPAGCRQYFRLLDGSFAHGGDFFGIVEVGFFAVRFFLFTGIQLQFFKCEPVRQNRAGQLVDPFNGFMVDHAAGGELRIAAQPGALCSAVRVFEAHCYLRPSYHRRAVSRLFLMRRGTKRM